MVDAPQNSDEDKYNNDTFEEDSEVDDDDAGSTEVSSGSRSGSEYEDIRDRHKQYAKLSKRSSFAQRRSAGSLGGRGFPQRRASAAYMNYDSSSDDDDEQVIFGETVADINNLSIPMEDEIPTDRTLVSYSKRRAIEDDLEKQEINDDDSIVVDDDYANTDDDRDNDDDDEDEDGYDNYEIDNTIDDYNDDDAIDDEGNDTDSLVSPEERNSVDGDEPLQDIVGNDLDMEHDNDENDYAEDEIVVNEKVNETATPSASDESDGSDMEAATERMAGGCPDGAGDFNYEELNNTQIAENEHFDNANCEADTNEKKVIDIDDKAQTGDEFESEESEVENIEEIVTAKLSELNQQQKMASIMSHMSDMFFANNMIKPEMAGEHLSQLKFDQSCDALLNLKNQIESCLRSTVNEITETKSHIQDMFTMGAAVSGRRFAENLELGDEAVEEESRDEAGEEEERGYDSQMDAEQDDEGQYKTGSDYEPSETEMDDGEPNGNNDNNELTDDPQIECHITSKTPSSFNTDEYALHMDLLRTSSTDKLRAGKQAQNRKSYSFSNDRVREIERQNKILLRKMMSLKPTYSNNLPKPSNQSNKFSALPPTTRTASAAVNRKKQQRQIDLDNDVLKRKLEAIGSRRRVF